jgi:Tfp pilus assembly protein PilO
MNRSLRPSTARLIGGLLLLTAAFTIAFFMLPDASQKRIKQEKAFREARTQLETQEAELGKLKARAENIRASRERMEEVLSRMPQENEGQLKWKLSRALYDLSTTHGIRILAVKYGSPTREGAKGTDLESLDVEFVASGVYQSLKAFMHAFEGSHLPFGLASGKLEETPEGARLTISVRAFRRTGQVKADVAGEES